MSDNLERLRAAYRAWDDSKGGETKPWLDIIADDFVMRSVGEEPSLHFAGVHQGAAMLSRFFEAILMDWRMEFYRVDALFEDGDRIAMFGTCSWTHRKTGITVTTPIACLWRFRDDKAVECVEIFDSAKAAAAAASV